MIKGAFQDLAYCCKKTNNRLFIDSILAICLDRISL